jgi:nicotinate phosphoribosyltransferase
MLSDLYKPSFGLLTDLYQLTMGYGYFENNMADQKSIFHLFFRKPPFGRKFAIAAGLATAKELVERFYFSSEDIDYLRSLKGNDGQVLFSEAYLTLLSNWRPNVEIYGVPEGSSIVEHCPLLRIEGPLLDCQLLETPLLTILNFQTLIASKSANICQAAKDDIVLEFGLRRAQGIDGGISASRAAYIGGCHATSNVLAAKMLGIPCKGTHAHSWVMSFDSEQESFERYAQAMPNNCIFLVDTYNTVDGVKNAVAEGMRLRNRGYKMMGVRLDSGDLLTLSKISRKLLDEAGFSEAKIVVSDSLDEHKITALKAGGAPIDIWGVGTNLVTAKDQPALGGVYKLGAIQDSEGTWHHRVKMSNTPIKVSNPGKLQIMRLRNSDVWMDILIDELDYSPVTEVVSLDGSIVRTVNISEFEPLLKAITSQDLASEDLNLIRAYSLEEQKRSTVDPQLFLSKTLYEQKQKCITEARNKQLEVPTL